MPFQLPTRIHLRPGVLEQLPNEVRRNNAGRILLVCDAEMHAAGWSHRVQTLAESTGATVHVFDGVVPNPRVDSVDAAAGIGRSNGVQLVIGLGGGSVLDTAKAAAMLIRNPGSCLDYEGRNRFPKPPIPFVAIPTTCGTGSEVTWVSVISDPGSRRKISIKGDGMFPACAIVDSDLLKTLPSHLIAQTGLDAATHAVEAYICRFANPVSDVLAAEALSLLLESLVEAADSRSSRALQAAARASTLAGMAFGNADVGAVHCLSESIGGLLDVPHGLMNAILLVPTLTYQLSIIQDRIASLELRIGMNPGSLLSELERLTGTLAIPSFDSLAVPTSAYRDIARQAQSNGSNEANRMPMSATDYLQILDSLTSVRVSRDL